MVRPYLTRASLVAIVAVVPFAFTAQAPATIVMQQGMADIKLGMTKSEVREELGKPRAVETGRNDFGSYTQYKFRGMLTVMFQGKPTVTSIRTSGRGERTKKGIGVGSSEARVKEKYPNVTCRTIARNRSCYIGTLSPGERVTDFNITDGHVRFVSVALVID